MSIVTIHGLSKKQLQLCSLPEGSQVLSVIVKQEHIYISAMHDVNAKGFGKRIEVAMFPDGRYFHVDGYTFLGTIVLDFGNTIYHVFYREVNN